MLGQHLIKVRHFTRLRKMSYDPRIKAVEENKMSVVSREETHALQHKRKKKDRLPAVFCDVVLIVNFR